MLKNCVLSSSSWHICGCCYLRCTHRLHPVLAALGTVCVSVKSQATGIPNSPRGWEIAGKAIRKWYYTLQTMVQRGRKNAFHDPNKSEVTNLQILYRQMAQFHQEQTRSNQYFCVCSRHVASRCKMPIQKGCLQQVKRFRVLWRKSVTSPQHSQQHATTKIKTSHQSCHKMTVWSLPHLY